MKKILVLTLCFAVTLMFVGCGEKQDFSGYKGVGIDEFTVIDIPSNFTASDSQKINKDKVVCMTWTTDGSAMRYTLLNYDGMNIKGDKNKKSLDEYTDGFTKTILFLGDDRAYIGYDKADGKTNNIIRAYIEHNGYLLSLELDNEDGAITDEQKFEFCNIVKSIKFTDEK